MLVTARLVDDGGRVDMLTHRPFVSLLLIGGGDPDCRLLSNNYITELAATLFDKLTNLETLYVPWIHAVVGASYRVCCSWR